jgi:hypothetical protein
MRRPPWISRPGGRRVFQLLAAVIVVAPSLLSAVPPPPPPRATIHGPDRLCTAHFGFRLMSGETAQQYMADFWVVSAPGLELGIRTDLPALEGPKARIVIPGLGTGERQRVREWPGNRYRGWVYAFPVGDGATVRIASDQFRGTGADGVLLGRVLVGAVRNALCASR